MRVPVVGDENISGFDHARADVAVHVQHRHDGAIWADQGTGLDHQVALRVVLVLGRHRAMERQQHAVHRQGVAQPRQETLT